MTVVGSVEYDVLGVIDPGRFDKSIDTPLNRAAARAGDRFGTVLGKTIAVAVRPFMRRAGDDMGDELASHGRQHGLTFGKLVGAGVTAGLGVASIGSGFDLLARGIRGSIDAAGDLDTAIGQSTRRFGAASAGVQAFAADTHRNLLLSERDALSAADAFGLLFRGGGVDASKAAALSVRLTGIAQNLSALDKVPVGDVLNALREGLQGNVEPLKDLGINLDAARVKAQAYAEGIARPVKDAAAIGRAQTVVAAATENLAKVQEVHGRGTLAAAEAQDKLSRAQEGLAKATAGSSGPLSANEALLARTSLLLRDTASTTGAAAGSMDDASVASQHLHAQLDRVSTQLGNRLLPYVLDGERKFSALIDQFQAGTGTGGEIRDTLGAVADVARDLGDVLGRTVVPAVKFFADHPDALKGVAESMVIYAAATKTAAIYSALIKAPPVAPGVPGEAGKGGKLLPLLGGPVGVGVVTGLVAAEVDKHLGPLSSKSYSGTPKLSPVVGKPSDYVRGPDGKLYPKGQVPGPPRSSFPIGPIAPFSNSELGAIGKQQRVAADAAKKAANDLHATQVRMRDDAIKTAKAQQYATDQQAAYEERQRQAVEAAEDAARARGEATTRALQGQLDKIRQQTDALTAYGDKIKDFRRGVVDKAGQFTALTSLASDPSRATAGGLLGSLQSRILAEKLFARNLTTLGQRGLDKGVLAELAQAGPDQRAYASALAAGTPDQIRALNAAERASRGVAAHLGNLTADQQFGANAIVTLNKKLAGLEAQQKRTNALLEAQPALIGKAVDQAGRNVKVAQKTGSRTAVTR